MRFRCPRGVRAGVSLWLITWLLVPAAALADPPGAGPVALPAAALPAAADEAAVPVRAWAAAQPFLAAADSAAEVTAERAVLRLEKFFAERKQRTRAFADGACPRRRTRWPPIRGAAGRRRF